MTGREHVRDLNFGVGDINSQPIKVDNNLWCCILTFHRGVNKGFHQQDAPALISGSRYVGWELVGLPRRTRRCYEIIYIRVPRQDTVNLWYTVALSRSLESASEWQESSKCGQLPLPRLRSRRSAVWGPENGTTQLGEDKEQYSSSPCPRSVSVSLSLSFSHLHSSFNHFEK